MTRVIRFTADPLLPAPLCLSLQDAWWYLAAKAVRCQQNELPDLARRYAKVCRDLIAAAAQPTNRLTFPDVPERQRVA